MADEAFDSDDDNAVATQEWTNAMQRRFKDGMRDGLSEGNEASLQKGFDVSYSESFNVNYSYARLRGILMALNTCIDNDENVATKKEIEKLIKTLSDQERDCAKVGNHQSSNSEDTEGAKGTSESYLEKYGSHHAQAVESIADDCRKILKTLDWNCDDIKRLL